jgi:hypothetical protein
LYWKVPAANAYATCLDVMAREIVRARRAVALGDADAPSLDQLMLWLGLSTKPAPSVLQSEDRDVLDKLRVAATGSITEDVLLDALALRLYEAEQALVLDLPASPEAVAKRLHEQGFTKDLMNSAFLSRLARELLPAQELQVTGTDGGFSCVGTSEVGSLLFTFKQVTYARTLAIAIRSFASRLFVREERLKGTCQETWREWHTGHAPYDAALSDTFITRSPNLWRLGEYVALHPNVRSVESPLDQRLRKILSAEGPQSFATAEERESLLRAVLHGAGDKAESWQPPTLAVFAAYLDVHPDFTIEDGLIRNTDAVGVRKRSRSRASSGRDSSIADS